MWAIIRFFIRTKEIWTYAVFLLIALNMIRVNRKISGYRIQRFGTETAALFHQKIGFIHHYLHLQEENRLLQQQNNALLNKIYRQKHASGFDFLPGFLFKTGRTVFLNNRGLHRFIIIDAGSEDSIRPDSGVMGLKGVAGIVTATGKHFSKVMLLNNPGISINVKLKNQPYQAYTEGDENDSRKIYLRDFPEEASVEEGDTVVTGGLSLIFPKNFPVGTVKTISRNPATGKREILIEPFEKFNTLTRVFIVNHPMKKALDSIVNDVQ